MYFSSTPKTYEPDESDLENAYDLKIHDNILPKSNTYQISLVSLLMTGSLGIITLKH